MGGSITIAQERLAPSCLAEGRRAAAGEPATRLRRMPATESPGSASPAVDRLVPPAAAGGRAASTADRAAGRPATARPCRVAGVVFALENVLYDATAWQRRLSALISAVGWEVSPQSVCAAWHAVTHAAGGNRPVACLERLGLPRPAADELARSSIFHGARDLDAMRPFPASRGVLTRLADEGVRLAAIGCELAPDAPDRPHSLLRRLGIESRVGIVPFDAREKGSLLSTLQDLAREWAIEPDSLAFVGRTTGELEAARMAGWRSFAIDPVPSASAGSLRVADWIELEEAMRAA